MTLQQERRRRARKSSRTLFSPWVPALGGVLAGLCLALTLALMGAGAAAALAAFFFGALVVGVPTLLLQHIARRVVDEMRASINVRPLLGDELLGSEAWAMDAALAEDLVTLVDRMRPSLVLECGAGQSTLLLAQRLRRNGHGRLISLDHDARYAELARERLRGAGLEAHAEIVHAPLEERQVGGARHSWYAPVYERLLDRPIDLLVVDGPPGRSGRQARYPAVPLLREHLADDCAIVMDDADRTDERRVAYRWAKELPARIRYRHGGRGRWLLWRGRRRF